MTDDEQPEEAPVDPGAVAPPREPRRYPSTIGGAFYLAVLATAVAGIVLVGFGVDWRIGVRVVAAALLADGLLRAALPSHDAGMLAVRSRWLDVAVMLVAATALLVLSIAIPDQPL